MTESKNEKLLKSFASYCRSNPSLRFWQALRNWSGFSFIYISNKSADDPKFKLEDTFYFQEKSK